MPESPVSKAGHLRLLALCLMLVVLGLGGYYGWRLSVAHQQLRADTLDNASTRAMQLANAQADHFDALLGGVDLAVRQFRDARQLDATSVLDATVHTTLTAFPAGALLNFSVVSAQGSITYAYQGAAVHSYVGDRDYFKFHTQSDGDQLFINRPIYSTSLQRWIIPVTRPIRRGKRFDGVVVVALSPEYLAHALAKLELGSGSDVATLVFLDGSYAARSHGLNEVMGKVLPPDRPFLKKDAAAHGYFRAPGNADGVPRIFAWSRLTGYPLIINVGLDEAAVLAPAQREIERSRRANATGLSVVLVLVSLVSALLLRTARQQRLLAGSEVIQRSTLDSTNDGVLVVDRAGKVITSNRRFRELWQIPEGVMQTGDEAQLLSQVHGQLADPEGFLRVVAQRYESDGEHTDTVLFKDGRVFERYTRSFMLAERPVRLWSFRDITERKQVEARLRLAANVFAHSYEGIVITDAHNRIEDVNPAFTRITGYARDEVLGQDPRILASGRQDSAYYESMWQSLSDKDFWRGEIWNRRKNGEIYAEMLSVSLVRNDAGRVQQHIGVFSDISMLKLHEVELNRIAHFDTLTGVPNRRLLADRLGQAIARARRSGRPMAVCYIDLDGFKPVNDRFGHAAGDLMLIEITRRFMALLRAEDTLARPGGDEFVLLLNDLARAEECFVVLERLLSAVRAPVLIAGVPVTVTASVGVALSPPDEHDPDMLLRHADQAMYSAKAMGKNRYHVFDPAGDRQYKVHHDRLRRLEAAFKTGEFVLHYQPKVDLRNGEVVGAEALLRWQHPDEGLLLPGAFLHLLAGSDLELAVGDWLIESVLAQMRVWQSLGVRLVVSANITSNHLLQPDFSQRLERALGRHPEVQASDLELEILETAALGDIERAANVLHDCRRQGVRFALDDFGTGYSSLAYFRRLPIDVLKIDRSFVRDMLHDPADRDIVESVVRLAQAFERAVIAEGVESMAHGAMLQRLGCHHCQGHGIAHPMPAVEFPTWMANWYAQGAWRDLAVAEGEVARPV